MKFVVIVACALWISGCTHDPVIPQYSGNYPPAVAAVVSENCLGGACHTGRNAINDSLDMTTWGALMQGSRYEYDVIPYLATQSHLFEHINTITLLAAQATPAMPLSRDPLSDADQRTIFDWINHGAPSAEGAIPYENVAHKVYALSEAEDRMIVLDDDARRIVRMTLINGSGSQLRPSCFCPTPDRTSIIVGAVDPNGTVRKYSLPDFSVVSEFSSKYYINDLVMTPDATKGYLTDYPPSGAARIGIFDPVAMSMTKSVPLDGMKSPYGLAATADGKYVYISGSQSDNIAKFDVGADTIAKLIPIASDIPSPLPDDYLPNYSPGFMTISPDGKRLYISCRNSSEIVTLDIATDSIVGRTAVPYSPFRTCLSPDGTELWVTCWTTSDVKIIDTKTMQVTATIDSINTNPRAVAFSRDGNVAYVCCEKLVGGVHNHGINGGAPPGGVYAIDAKSKRIIYSFASPGYLTQIIGGF